MKKCLSIIMAIVLVTSCAIPAYAAKGDENFTVGRSFTWSPFTTTHAFGGQVISGGQVESNYIVAWTDFYWNAAGATNMNNSGYYATLEQNALDGTGLSAGDQYCNIANVHFDADDDNWDGDDEESEVVFLGDVSANTDYVFNTDFDRTSNAGLTGFINVIAQQSNKFLTEYNSQAYDLLEQADWEWGYSSRSSMRGNTNSTVSEYLVGESRSKFLVHDAGTTQAELTEYFDAQQADFTGLLAQTPKMINSLDEEEVESTKVTVTFAEPISMNEMMEIFASVGGNMHRYKAKFINADGEWCNMSSNKTDEEAMVANANRIATNAEKPHISYEGIVSAEVYIPATQDAMDELNSSHQVFCVDASEYIWMHGDDYDPTVEIMVPDYAWEVANF